MLITDVAGLTLAATARLTQDEVGTAPAITAEISVLSDDLAQSALHVIDTIMLGWYGVTELAAVVLGASSFFVVFILGAGFAQAVMPLVAAALGRGDEVQVRRDTRMGIWLSIIYGLLTYPLFFLFGYILALLPNGFTAMRTNARPALVGGMTDIRRAPRIRLQGWRGALRPLRIVGCESL
ncbi:MAG: hypothetical protein HC767_07285, partial [Akkermansiaceae bacterium]|nr:hypothetical protein [Akkermansiaceae bacterium]